MLSTAVLAALTFALPPVPPALGEDGGEAMVEPEAAPRFGYDKGFFVETADKAFRVQGGGRIQMRYTLEAGAGEGGGYAASESAFSIPRARLKVKGNAFTPSLHYVLQLDMGKGFVSLKDAYITLDLLGDHLRLRVGEFKRGFSRQQLMSTSKIAMVERAITDNYFGAGRDIGVALMGGKEKNGIA